MNHRRLTFSTAVLVLGSFVLPYSLHPGASSAHADETTTPAPTTRELKLAKYLSGTQFIGKFTVDGMDGSPKTEAYTIKSCEKLSGADLYRFTARIKYGSVDQEVPMDLKILWSGNTPVITLDSLWIPGMGTFDSRVLIQPGTVTDSGTTSGRYAGTWQHGDKGGHLYGKIVPIDPTQASNEDATPTDAASDNTTDNK